ncbi:TrkH family potassium uptake protein [Peribacillus muralis]|uniref:TrkH family potassium uptake protein n=1 Tax=Peribacillus muralis TaxID=264697 RepID=UPI001F4D931D|nr:TrkH family potassium uptake protein [Peribacillus muralis]MCK1995573.1 TrkH family potassium uptake protein [Peribacillus muralis]MCK2016125.1 TrkH family potassium uptake protein [Peribacillus muralis]
MNSKIENLTKRLSAAQIIVFYYLVAVVVSTILLLLPITQKQNAELSFIDGVFISISAVTVTGLSTADVSQLLSVPGTFIFTIILQFGGIGIVAFGTILWLSGKKIGLKARILMTTEQNSPTYSGIVRFIRMIFFFFVMIELLGAVVFGTYFLKYFPTWQEAYLQGFFASVSATTNAGFDITGKSLIPFADDYFVLTLNIVLFIIGALGFPVLMEVSQWLRHKGKTPFRFSLFTKITTATFFILIVIGAILVYLFEYSHFYSDKTWHQSFVHSLFYSTSSRTGGMAISDVNQFSVPTLLLLSIFMFIGASPSSAGGGIRTTTFAVMLLAIYNYAKGNRTIKIFKREIDDEDIIKSFIVFTTGMILCSVAVVILACIESSFSLMEILFEVSSAFGTVGLSLGITPELSTAGKVVIMTLMFIGKIGIFTFLFSMGGKPVKHAYHYPKERIIIG